MKADVGPDRVSPLSNSRSYSSKRCATRSSQGEDERREFAERCRRLPNRLAHREPVAQDVSGFVPFGRRMTYSELELSLCQATVRRRRHRRFDHLRHHAEIRATDRKVALSVATNSESAT
jgi:hypothetical protein